MICVLTGKLFRARSRLLGSQNSREFGNIVSGDFTPVLAKHTKSFNLVDTLSVGVDRIQRNCEPLQRQVELWRKTQVTDERAKLIFYNAFNVQLAGSQIDFEPGGQLVTGACLRTAGIDL